MNGLAPRVDKREIGELRQLVGLERKGVQGREIAAAEGLAQGGQRHRGGVAVIETLQLTRVRAARHRHQHRAAAKHAHIVEIDRLFGIDDAEFTNADGAEDFKVVRAPISTPGRQHWRDAVPHVPGRLIERVICFAGHVVRLEREGGLQRLVITSTSGDEHTVAFDEPVYELGLQRGLEFDTTTVRFTYSSLTTPEQTFDYDMRARTRVIRKQQPVPSGHDPAQYRSARVFATSHDGEQVPVSLLWKASTPLDGTAPVLLYGYGSYGLTIPPGFSVARLSLVDRGFIWALAHIRGGKDKGYGWYRHGRELEKKNTFLDFIAAAFIFIVAVRFLDATGEALNKACSLANGAINAVENMPVAVASLAFKPFIAIAFRASVVVWPAQSPCVISGNVHHAPPFGVGGAGNGDHRFGIVRGDHLSLRTLQ